MPERHRAVAMARLAAIAGHELMPWQSRAVATMTGLDDDGTWLYPEFALVVSRQNGKTTLLLARILLGLLRGERIVHGAQSRDVPRETFEAVVETMTGHPLLARLVKGRPRLTNGQERLRTVTGGRYRIVSTKTAAARSQTNDTLIIDEVREQRTTKFMASASSNLLTSPNPQTIYVSNAGDAESVVLNELRRRALKGDPELAYLEWSAHPDRPIADRDGWAEANPALGWTVTWEALERELRKNPPSVFETENLCRWVPSMRPRVVAVEQWARCAASLGEPAAGARPALGVALDPSGIRLSAVLAVPLDDGRIGIQVAADVHGKVGDDGEIAPVDVAQVVTELNRRIRAAKVRHVGFDPWVDKDLARRVTRAKTHPITGADAANAAALFVRLVEHVQLAHGGAPEIAGDIPWLERHSRSDGTWYAARGDEHPVSAALAAVRAVWLATNPPAPRGSIH